MKSSAIFVIALAGCGASCKRQEAAVRPAGVQSSSERHIAPQAEPSPASVELLDLASRVANLIPAEPHRKTRSRVQELVAGACLELGAPDRAVGIVEQIENWRRGTGLADIAYYRAKHGNRNEAERLAALAATVAEQVAADPAEQEWRAGRVNAKLVRVWLLLGQPDRAANLADGLPDSELLHVERARAEQVKPEELDARLAQLDETLAKGNYEQVTAALEVCVRLYARYHGQGEYGARLALRATRGTEKLPRQHALNVHLQLATAALENGDPQSAKTWLRDARAILDLGRWAPEHKAALAARIAATRAKAGDRERARFEIDEALALVETERDKIIDIDRADALCPLAEAYGALGDEIACQQTYLQALDEALVNPNSVPRAEDIVAICLSLAGHSINPDAMLRKRLTEAVGGLSSPW